MSKQPAKIPTEADRAVIFGPERRTTSHFEIKVEIKENETIEKEDITQHIQHKSTDTLNKNTGDGTGVVHRRKGIVLFWACTSTMTLRSIVTEVVKDFGINQYRV
eukprot:TRINITY_DN639_c0_g1_i1.p2 TRINITY_DN639_c0_g1~~TRINITY_DN639_c0_g1_i1.p2  ORF type:complete len:105 (+),score=10.71 TRINITY_DN639_c0_g1_i1:434-748(+)